VQQYKVNLDTFLSYFVKPSSYKDLEGNLFYTDLSNLRTPARIFPGVFHEITDYNFLKHGDQFKAGPYEWISFILARVLVEKLNSVDSVCLELGSSYSPWCASWINSFRPNSVYSSKFNLGREQVTTCYGIEAADCSAITKDFWELNFGPGNQKSLNNSDSKLYFQRDNWTYHLLNYALVSDNVKGLDKVFFPKIDLRTDNGAQISIKDISVDYRGLEIQHIKTECITIHNLTSRIQEGQDLAFTHLDLQGLEFELAMSGSLDSLKKSFVICLGVHDSDPNKIFRETFKESHTVIFESPAKFNFSGALVEDGEQIFIRNDLLKLLMPEFLFDT
jgi:hypothetical protein